MAYATVADLLEVLSEKEQMELTDDDPVDGEEPAQDRLQKTINRAGSIVDSYLAKRFSLPLTEVPDSVKDATLVIAKRKLFGRRGFVSEELQSEYDGTLRWLREVAAGIVDLPEIVTGESDDVAAFGFGTDSMFGKQIF